MLDFNKYYETLLKGNAQTTIQTGGRIYSYSITMSVFNKQNFPAAFDGNLGIKPSIFIKQETVNEGLQVGSYAVYLVVYGFNISNVIQEQIIKTIVGNTGDDGIYGVRLMGYVPSEYSEQLRCSTSLMRFRIEYKWQELQSSL